MQRLQTFFFSFLLRFLLFFNFTFFDVFEIILNFFISIPILAETLQFLPQSRLIVTFSHVILVPENPVRGLTGFTDPNHYQNMHSVVLTRDLLHKEASELVT